MVNEALQQPVEYRYPNDERPKQPPMDSEPFDPPTDHWVNCWDMNPIVNGGRFVRFDADFDEWEIVAVNPPSVHHGDEHTIEVIGVHPSDVWEDPDDPMTDYTDSMKWILDQFPDHPIHPNAKRFLENVTYYVADFTHKTHGSADYVVIGHDVDAYWDELSGYDIDPADVSGVHDGYLPDGVTGYDGD